MGLREFAQASYLLTGLRSEQDEICGLGAYVEHLAAEQEPIRDYFHMLASTMLDGYTTSVALIQTFTGGSTPPLLDMCQGAAPWLFILRFLMIALDGVSSWRKVDRGIPDHCHY